MNRLLIVLSLFTLCACSNLTDKKFEVNKSLDYCATQTERTLKELKSEPGFDYSMMPRCIKKDSSKWICRKATKEEWTSGFWPGVLWYDYEYTNDPTIKAEAEKFTESLAFLSMTPAYDHDLGFLVFNSFGNAYRITGKPAYKQIVLNAADSLATLFNPKVGTILSWPREMNAKQPYHNTIIDNMINLEMLFWAAKNGENKELYDIAVKHANKTMQNHFRKDYSSFHVVLYDPQTGDFVKGKTHQGYSDESMWARGQSWAIYGFTMCYRETKDKKYLDFAKNVADIYLKRLPEDKIPYWDFDDPDIPNAPRDASAACVVASALLELSCYVNPQDSARYKNDAVAMLSKLSSKDYISADKNPSFLLHSTGHKPNGSEVDASIIYADYYYIEALLRLKKLNEGKKLF